MDIFISYWQLLSIKCFIKFINFGCCVLPTLSSLVLDRSKSYSRMCLCIEWNNFKLKWLSVVSFQHNSHLCHLAPRRSPRSLPSWAATKRDWIGYAFFPAQFFTHEPKRGLFDPSPWASQGISFACSHRIERSSAPHEMQEQPCSRGCTTPADVCLQLRLCLLETRQTVGSAKDHLPLAAIPL